MIFFQAASTQAAEADAAAAAGKTQAYSGADTCAGCHAAEYEQWQSSKHAGAFSATFTRFWEEAHKHPDCLACHTTGFNKADATYAFKGISCESCHGALEPKHPDGAKMPLPVDVSACKECHQRTFREWQLSGHAKANIRCFDCHEVHRQGLRQKDVEQHCGACHAERLQDFAHATHHLQGLTCTTCHMPQSPDAGVIAGTATPPHSFFVGAQTCAACHEEMVHKSHKISTLAQEVDRLTENTDVKHVEGLEKKVQQVELQLDIQRSKTVKAVLFGLLGGLFAGVFIAWIGQQHKNR
jgi:hypothetical protein